MSLHLDCNEICACHSRNRLQQDTLYTVEHYRGEWMSNFTGQQCYLRELLATGDSDFGNSTGPNDGAKITAVMNSYLSPPVILLTMVTNIFVCIVLTRRNMISPTNVLLLAMAFVDMITGLLPLPWYLMIAYVKQFVIGQLCSSHYVANLMELMVITMPTICHTISIWLTVMLAVQRWIYITFPTSVKRICTVQKSIVSIAILCLVTILFYTVTQLLWSGSIYFRMRPHSDKGDRGMLGHYAVVSCSVNEHKRYFIGAMIVRTLLVNIIPSFLLTIITGLLIRGLHRANKRRQQLRSSSSGNSNSKQLTGSCARRASAGDANRKRQEQKSSGTTLMLIIIVGLFLLVELPMTVIMTVFVLMIADLVGPEAWLLMNRSFPFVNFIILVSYPVNFFIYCLMSTQFRQTFANLFISSEHRRQPPVCQSVAATQQRRRSESPRLAAGQLEMKRQQDQETMALTNNRLDGEV